MTRWCRRSHFPLLHNALLQLLYSPDVLPVDSLLALVSLQKADISTSVVNVVQLLLLMLSFIVALK